MKKLSVLAVLLMLLTSCSTRIENIEFSWENSDGSFVYSAWKGEKISAKATLSADIDLENLKVRVGRVRNGSYEIPVGNIKVHFVKYVMGDVLNDGYGQCGARNKGQYDSILVADMLDAPELDIAKADRSQPVWLSIKVPADAEPGIYEGKVTLSCNYGKVILPFEFDVADMTLPEPSEWKFHLDLWQNPYSVARYHGVELWSDAHFRYMEPVMKLLADAGQKVITTTIMNRPWNGQTEDAFGSMVTKTLRKDGAWSYGYEVFDKWVEFMMGLGIDRQISCYTLIPWNLEFDYFDEKTGQQMVVKAKPSSVEYKSYWGLFLADFAQHLREKGWYEKTVIAMDERSEAAMNAALELIRAVQPDFKVSLAGSWHESLESELHDYCIAFRQDYPEGVLEKRQAEGKVTTFYTCCAERYPNTFLMSPRSEATWIPWYALSKGYDGYLRWAYNSWTADPVADARFRTWPAGDCYMVYPNGRSSVRFEKLIEGIQDYEKARILMDKWNQKGEEDKMKELIEALKDFTFEEISAGRCEETLRKAKDVINAQL